MSENDVAAMTFEEIVDERAPAAQLLVSCDGEQRRPDRAGEPWLWHREALDGRKRCFEGLVTPIGSLAIVLV